jgi:hypothetical protein
MQKLIVLMLAVSISFQSFADCRSKIDANLVDLRGENSQTNQNLGVGIGLGTILIFAYAPLGITLVGIAGAGSAIHEVRKNNLQGLKQAIDDAYYFVETNDAGKKLKKLLNKVNRKADHEITMNELVDSIITSNENEDLCTAKSLNSFAKKISVKIE